MRVFTSRDFPGLWPVGTAAVVVAEDETRASFLLQQALVAAGLKAGPFTLQEVSLSAPGVTILCDGDY